MSNESAMSLRNLVVGKLVPELVDSYLRGQTPASMLASEYIATSQRWSMQAYINPMLGDAVERDLGERYAEQL